MANPLFFNEKESDQIARISQYYEVTKELLIFGETIDPKNRTLAQAINELRNCLDHLMRVTMVRQGLREPEGEPVDYVTVNLDKAYGHVYRAAYDVLDWVSLTFKGRIVTELEGFSLETIQAVIPEYFPELRPRFEQILTGDIVKLRLEKDIALTNEDNLVKYGLVTTELREIFDKITVRKTALIEHRQMQQEGIRRAGRRRIMETLVVAIIAGTIVGLFVWAVTG